MMNTKGFTLIETSIAVTVFAIIIIAGSSLLLYANDVSGKLRLKNEMLTNARIAADFLCTQIRYAESYTLKTDSNSLKSLEVRYKEGEPIPSNTKHLFEFNKGSNTLRFGGQVLAEYISDILVYNENDILTVTIKTLEKTWEESKLSVESVEITFKEGVKHKTNTP